MVVQSGLCRTWLETPKTGFLTTMLICVKTLFAAENKVFDKNIVVKLYRYLSVGFLIKMFSLVWPKHFLVWPHFAGR